MTLLLAGDGGEKQNRKSLKCLNQFSSFISFSVRMACLDGSAANRGGLETGKPASNHSGTTGNTGHCCWLGVGMLQRRLVNECALKRAFVPGTDFLFPFPGWTGGGLGWKIGP